MRAMFPSLSARFGSIESIAIKCFNRLLPHSRLMMSKGYSPFLSCRLMLDTFNRLLSIYHRVRWHTVKMGDELLMYRLTIVRCVRSGRFGEFWSVTLHHNANK